MDWNKVDTQLAKYLKTYKRKQLDLKDNIQAILDMGIEDYNAIVSKSDLSRFKRFLIKNEELVKQNDYIAYMTQKYLKKSKINYHELLKIMILVEYGKFEAEIYPEQLDTLETIVNNVSVDIQEKCEKLTKKRLKLHPWDIALAFLLMPNEKGLTYQEQSNANTIYNAEEMYKQIIVKLDLDYVLDKQRNREIAKKKDNTEYYGYIDDESTFILNQLMLEYYKQYGFKSCKFVARMDDLTTKMCKTLDDQKFSFTGINTYSRYSALDKKDILYVTEGMVVGENLPPINNHYHHCRSHIDPIVTESDITKSKYEAYDNSYKKTIENNKDDKYVQWAEPKWLKQFAQHGKTGENATKTEKEYNELKEDIINNGVEDGVGLLYDASDGYTTITEGNNRLAIMEELQYPKIPVYIIRTTSNSNRIKGAYLTPGLGNSNKKYMTLEELLEDEK